MTLRMQDGRTGGLMKQSLAHAPELPEPPEFALLELELDEAELLGLRGGEERGEAGGELPGLLRCLGFGHLFA